MALRLLEPTSGRGVLFQNAPATTPGIRVEMETDYKEDIAKMWEALPGSDNLSDIVNLIKLFLGTRSRKDYDYQESVDTRSTISVREDSTEAHLTNGQKQASGPIIIDVTFSPQIAADLKAKKIRAFAPISASELIWLESLPTDDDSHE